MEQEHPSDAEQALDEAQLLSLAERFECEMHPLLVDLNSPLVYLSNDIITGDNHHDNCTSPAVPTSAPVDLKVSPTSILEKIEGDSLQGPHYNPSGGKPNLVAENRLRRRTLRPADYKGPQLALYKVQADEDFEDVCQIFGNPDSMKHFGSETPWPDATVRERLVQWSYRWELGLPSWYIVRRRSRQLVGGIGFLCSRNDRSVLDPDNPDGVINVNMFTPMLSQFKQPQVIMEAVCLALQHLCQDAPSFVELSKGRFNLRGTTPSDYHIFLDYFNHLQFVREKDDVWIETQVGLLRRQRYTKFLAVADIAAFVEPILKGAPTHAEAMNARVSTAKVLNGAIHEPHPLIDVPHDGWPDVIYADKSTSVTIQLLSPIQEWQFILVTIVREDGRVAAQMRCSHNFRRPVPFTRVDVEGSTVTLSLRAMSAQDKRCFACCQLVLAANLRTVACWHSPFFEVRRAPAKGAKTPAKRTKAPAKRRRRLPESTTR